MAATSISSDAEALDLTALSSSLAFPIEPVSFQEKVIAYRCSEGQLSTVLMTPSIPDASRILTTLLFYFPYIEQPLMKHVTVHNFDFFQSTHAAQIALRRRPLHEEVETKVGSFICLMMPKYPRENQTAQLYKRFSAACASIGRAPLGLERFVKIKDDLGIKVQCCTNAVSYGLGLALATNDNWEHDPLITICGLPSDYAYKSKYHRDWWHGEVLDQMRTVYSHHRMKTLRFAFAAIDPVRSAKASLCPELEQEQEAILAAREKYRDSPYAGLQYTIPEDMKIAKTPHWCLLGLHYHQRLLDGKAEWVKYNIKDVAKHIPQVSVRNSIAQIAERLPHSMQMLALHYIESDMPRLMIEQLMRSMTPHDVDRLREMAFSAAPTSRWALRERARIAAHGTDHAHAERLIEEYADSLNLPWLSPFNKLKQLMRLIRELRPSDNAMVDFFDLIDPPEGHIHVETAVLPQPTSNSETTLECFTHKSDEKDSTDQDTMIGTHET